MADSKGGNTGGSTDPKALEEVNKITESIAKRVRATTDSFTEQQKIIEGLRDVLAKMSEDFEKMDATSQKFFSPDSWKKVDKALEKTQKDAKGMNGALEKSAKTMQSKWVPASLAAVAAMTGLRQGMKNLTGLLKGGVSIFTSVVDSMWNIGKAILAIPFGMLKSLTDMAQNGMGGNELALAYEEVRKSFGAFTSVSSDAVISTARDMKGFADTGLSTYQVFGTLAETLTKVTEVAKAMGPQFAANAEEFKKSGGAILAYQKGLGIADDAMAGIAVRGAAMGKDMGTVLNDMTKQSYGLAKAFGLDAKVISRDMSKAMSDMGHFGHLSNKELAASVTYANKLGISFDKMTALMDKFATFDSAAESVSTLNEQFGTNIDAMELMSAQTPAEKMEILRKSLQATGKDLSKMNYQERMLIANQTGMEIGALDAAMAQKNQGVSLEKIKSESEKAADATLSQTEAMKQLAPAIERLARAGERMGGFLDHLIAGFTLGIQQLPEFRQLMMNINRDLMITFQTGIKLGKMFVNSFPGLKQFITSLRDLFDPAKFQHLADGVMKVLGDFAGDKGDFSTAFEKLMTNLRKVFFDFFDMNSAAGKGVLDAMKKMGLAAVNIFSKMAQWAMKELAGLLKYVVEFIKHPDLPNMKGGKAAVSPWIEPILDAFVTFKKVLLPVLFDLGKAVWDRLKQALMSGTGKKAMLGMLATVIGPAIGQALLSGISSMLIKGLGSSITKAIAGSEAEVAKTAASGAEKIAGKAAGGASKVLGKVALVAMIADAAVNVSEAMKEFEDKLAPEFGRAEAKMGAAASGIINTLTLGLLPKGIQEEIAKAIAGLAKSIFKALEKSMGPGFTQVAKEYIGSALDVFAALGDTIKAIFSGDDKKMEDAFQALAEKIMVFLGKAIQWVILGIPTLSFKISSMFRHLLGALLNGVADALGPFGAGLKLTAKLFTGFIELMDSAFDGLKTLIKPVLDFINDSVDWAKDQYKKLQDLLPDFMKDTQEIGKMAFQGAKDAQKAWKKADDSHSDSKEWKSIGVDATGGLHSGIQYGLDQINKTLEKKSTKVRTSLIDTDDINKMLDKLPQLVEKIGSSLKNIPGNPEDTTKKLDTLRALLTVVSEIPAMFKAFATSTEDSEISETSLMEKLKSVQNVVTWALNPSTMGGSLVNIAAVVNTSKIESINKTKIDAIKATVDSIKMLSEIFTIANAFKGPSGTIETMPLLEKMTRVAKLAEFLLNSSESTNLGDKVMQAALPAIVDTINGSKLMPVNKEKLTALKDTFDAITSLSSIGNSFTTAIKTDAIAPALMAVIEMVKATQQLDDALNMLPKIDISTKLGKVAKMAGLGSKGVYTVNSKDVVISIDLTVTMDAGEVEKVIIGRKKSVLRDRINAALEGTSKKPLLRSDGADNDVNASSHESQNL